jgi:hypothetical protein
VDIFSKKKLRGLAVSPTFASRINLAVFFFTDNVVKIEIEICFFTAYPSMSQVFGQLCQAKGRQLGKLERRADEQYALINARGFGRNYI